MQSDFKAKGVCEAIDLHVLLEVVACNAESHALIVIAEIR
jgi:hypothetical protein